MATDIQIFIIALILSGMIYGSISGYSIYCGDNQDRQPMSRLMKLLLFPFAMSVIWSEKAVIWWMGWIEYETLDQGD